MFLYLRHKRRLAAEAFAEPAPSDSGVDGLLLEDVLATLSPTALLNEGEDRNKAPRGGLNLSHFHQPHHVNTAVYPPTHSHNKGELVLRSPTLPPGGLVHALLRSNSMPPTRLSVTPPATAAAVPLTSWPAQSLDKGSRGDGDGARGDGGEGEAPPGGGSLFFANMMRGAVAAISRVSRGMSRAERGGDETPRSARSSRELELPPPLLPPPPPPSPRHTSSAPPPPPADEGEARQKSERSGSAATQVRGRGHYWGGDPAAVRNAITAAPAAPRGNDELA